METTSPGPGQSGNVNRVALIVPNWKGTRTLDPNLREIPSFGQVIFVTSSSVAASPKGATCIVERRRGYGVACLRGLAALEERVGQGETPPEVVVFLDGDHIQDSGMIAQFVRPIMEGETDFVLGSRMLGSHAKRTSRPHIVWSNRLACFLMRHLFGAEYTDLGPIRAIDYYALKSLAMSDRSFGWSIEMQIKAVLAKLRTREIPVPDRGHAAYGRIRETIQGAVATAKILYTLVKYRLLGLTRLTAAGR